MVSVPQAPHRPVAGASMPTLRAKLATVSAAPPEVVPAEPRPLETKTVCLSGRTRNLGAAHSLGDGLPIGPDMAGVGWAGLRSLILLNVDG